MKKSSRDAKSNELLVNIVEYTFIQWLRPRGIFSAFKTNFECVHGSNKDFHESFRAHVRHCLSSVGVDASCLISTAFFFSSTPEGIDFWVEQSNAWKDFCITLRAEL